MARQRLTTQAYFDTRAKRRGNPHQLTLPDGAYTHSENGLQYLCPKHGLRWAARARSWDLRCDQCTREASRISRDSVERRLRKATQGRIQLVEITGNLDTAPLVVKCRLHPWVVPFRRRYYNLLSGGHNCPECVDEKRALAARINAGHSPEDANTFVLRRRTARAAMARHQDRIGAPVNLRPPVAPPKRT